MKTEKATQKVIGDNTGYGVIHEEYVERETESRCFKRHEISIAQWCKMTAKDELRFWKARGIIRGYTNFGYMVVGHSRRRWGDNLKVLDRFYPVKSGQEFTPVDVDIDSIAR